MGLQTTNEVNVKKLYKAGAGINIYPVSKGTFTVTAYSNGKNYKSTGLSFEETRSAVLSAWAWLDDQVEFLG